MFSAAVCCVLAADVWLVYVDGCCLRRAVYSPWLRVDVCCLLPVVWRLLIVVVCGCVLLFVVVCSFLLFAVCTWKLFSVGVCCVVLFVVRWCLFVGCCSLFVVCCYFGFCLMSVVVCVCLLFAVVC